MGSSTTTATSAALLAIALAACGGSGGDGLGDDLPSYDARPYRDAGPSPLQPEHFRFGLNIGIRNPAWDDATNAELGARAGAHSLRVKLPASHLETWGDEIEVGDLSAYAALDMGNHIGFLIGAPDRARSTMPPEAADWENEFYPPTGLYEPIFLEGGAVNPANTWADYVARVVSTYQPWIHVWHVWNEPDYVGDWSVTETWDTTAPTAEQLIRYRGSIFDYVRMLRITREVARQVDPDALIATGGIGYPNFLDAIMRYSDNPDGGAVTAEFPATGAAYVDVIDFHYYPLFGPRSSDAGADGMLALQAELQAVLDAHDKDVVGWNMSEIGAPLVALGDYPGGEALATSFLVKAAVLAQQRGIAGMDWFILSNNDDQADPWGRMGLYQDLANAASPDDAQATALGVTYQTTSSLLRDLAVDDEATAALALPAGARGVALRDPAGTRRVVVAWARTPEASETASATWTLPPDLADAELVTLGGERSAAGSTVALTGAPVFVVAE